jgi:hypothetical protein
VGAPLWFGLDRNGLSQRDLLKVGWQAQVMLTACSHVVPLLAASFIVRWRDLLASWPFILLSIWAAQVPALGLSFVSTEFSSLLGGIVSVLVVGALSHFKIGLGAHPGPKFWHPKGDSGASAASNGDAKFRSPTQLQHRLELSVGPGGGDTQFSTVDLGTARANELYDPTPGHTLPRAAAETEVPLPQNRRGIVRRGGARDDHRKSDIPGPSRVKAHRHSSKPVGRTGCAAVVHTNGPKPADAAVEPLASGASTFMHGAFMHGGELVDTTNPQPTGTSDRMHGGGAIDTCWLQPDAASAGMRGSRGPRGLRAKAQAGDGKGTNATGHLPLAAPIAKCHGRGVAEAMENSESLCFVASPQAAGPPKVHLPYMGLQESCGLLAAACSHQAHEPSPLEWQVRSSPLGYADRRRSSERLGAVGAMALAEVGKGFGNECDLAFFSSPTIRGVDVQGRLWGGPDVCLASCRPAPRPSTFTPPATVTHNPAPSADLLWLCKTCSVAARASEAAEPTQFLSSARGDIIKCPPAVPVGEASERVLPPTPGDSFLSLTTPRARRDRRALLDALPSSSVSVPLQHVRSRSHNTPIKVPRHTPSRRSASPVGGTASADALLERAHWAARNLSLMHSTEGASSGECMVASREEGGKGRIFGAGHEKATFTLEASPSAQKVSARASPSPRPWPLPWEGSVKEGARVQVTAATPHRVAATKDALEEMQDKLPRVATSGIDTGGQSNRL